MFDDWEWKGSDLCLSQCRSGGGCAVAVCALWWLCCGCAVAVYALLWLCMLCGVCVMLCLKQY